jgi:hypothetical protein
VEKRLVTASYWLGLLSSLIAMGLWGLSILGRLARNVALVRSVGWYESFFKGAILFLLIAIATASYTFVRSEKTL